MKENLSNVSGTLFVPMAGRIFASHRFPHIVHDEKALMLEKKISTQIDIFKGQSEYTLVASAVRSMNMDAAVNSFLKENPSGIIVNLGCGLETTFYRTDNGTATWYELDLPEVIELREKYLGKHERDISIPASVFDEEWGGIVKESANRKNVLFLASGLLYYFEKPQVTTLLKRIASIPNAILVFDTVNSSGMKRMAGYMRQLGHEDAAMYFYVDDAKELANEICDTVTVIEERPYYSRVKNRKGMKFITKISMSISDKFNMVKMISLKMN